jgi:hypothetical protein
MVGQTWKAPEQWLATTVRFSIFSLIIGLQDEDTISTSTQE